MDKLDRRIVEILQVRGDITHAELAVATNSTASTCLRRTAALKKKGILKANVYQVDPVKIGRGIRAIITVETRDHPLKARKKFVSRLKKEIAIRDAYGLTGELDAILVANFQDMDEYQSFCDRLFDGVETIVRYTTYFATEIYMENVGIQPSE